MKGKMKGEKVKQVSSKAEKYIVKLDGENGVTRVQKGKFEVEVSN